MPPTLTVEHLAVLLQPYIAGLQLPDGIYEQCAEYLSLLLHWNARTNLTAVRDPEQLATRQLGESLFAARMVANHGTLLDFGSGAGFPGIPLQLAHPGLVVTLAESQGKKAGFLREAIRVLRLPSQVWAMRVETMPKVRTFDTVAMRAVDRSAAMAVVAADRVRSGGSLLRFEPQQESATAVEGWAVDAEAVVPGSDGRLVRLRRTGVFHVEHSIEPDPSSCW